MTRFWVSWYEAQAGQVDDEACLKGIPFTYHGPWWESGYRLLDDGGSQGTICAAVLADDEAHAKRIIGDCHDSPVVIEWRFCNARDEDWEPFCDRFPRADWMQWPWPEVVY